MTDAKVTKDDLSHKLADAQAEIERLRQASQQRDEDARAIDVCAKALDALWKASTSPRGYGSSYSSEPPASASVVRVLNYLRQRYGIPDASAEADRLHRELEQTRVELESLRRRFSQVYEAVQS